MTRQEKIRNLKNDLRDKYSLSQNEANALVMFKGAYCIGLNKKIRSNTLTSKEKIFCNSLKNGLLKIPSTTDKIIYRHLNFIDFQIKKIENYFQNRVGKEIRFQEFQSCTLKECFTGDPKHYNWSMKIFTTQPTNAKDIHILWDKHALNDAEKEVLLLDNTCFQVISIDSNSIIKVHLKEIQPDLQIESVPEF